MLGGANSHSGEDQSARLRERLFQIVKKYYQMNIKSKLILFWITSFYRKKNTALLQLTLIPYTPYYR